MMCQVLKSPVSFKAKIFMALGMAVGLMSSGSVRADALATPAVAKIAETKTENIKNFHDQNLQKFFNVFYDAQGKVSAAGEEWQHTLGCHSVRVIDEQIRPYDAFKKFVREDMLGESENKLENHCLRKVITSPAKAQKSVQLLEKMTRAKGDYKKAIAKLAAPLKVLIVDAQLKTFVCAHQGKSARNEFGWYVASYDAKNQEVLVCSADNFNPP